MPYHLLLMLLLFAMHNLLQQHAHTLAAASTCNVPGEEALAWLLLELLHGRVLSTTLTLVLLLLLLLLDMMML